MQEKLENNGSNFPLSFISDIESDIAALRSQNPRLLVLASLGGEAVKATTFSSFITDRESLNNLTSSINNHYRSGLLDGVEIDWEWPFQGGDKKDRIKMIRYARVRKTINLSKFSIKGTKKELSQLLTYEYVKTEENY